MSFLPNLRRLLVIYQDSWKQFVFAETLVLIAAVFTLLIPTQVGRLINEGILVMNKDVIIDSSLQMMLYAFLSGMFVLANLIFAAAFAEGTANYIRTRVFRKVQTYSFGNLDKYPTGELLIRLTSDIYQIKLAANMVVRFLFQAPFQLAVAIVLVWINSPNLVWVMVAMIVVTAAMLLIFTISVQPMYKVRQQKLDSINTILQEDLAGIRVVKAFERQEYENQRYNKVNTSYRDAALAPMKVTAFLGAGLQAILGFTMALIAWVGGSSVLQGTGVSIGEVVSASQYLLVVMTPLITLALVLPQIAAADASAGRVFELVDTEPVVQDKPGAKTLDPDKVKGRVVFDNVGFSYEQDGKTYTIRNINLVAEPGETVAFLGATGAGKSTLINLIPRFYDVSEGSITIDGVDVRDITQESLRQIVAVTLQEAILFSGQLRDNLKYGRPDATDDEMIIAAQVADAEAFINAIPEKYDAQVARRGTNFSGGQRQRLSIARAVAVRPKVIILDDSTSAVDVATESRIQGKMEEVLQGTTTFIVAQRMSTVLLADKIILLENGKVVAMGSHKELMKSSPLYQEIFESQLGGVTKEDIQ